MKRSELVEKLNKLPDIDVVVLCDYVNEIFDVKLEQCRCLVIHVIKPDDVEPSKDVKRATQMGARPIDVNIKDWPKLRRSWLDRVKTYLMLP